MPPFIIEDRSAGLVCPRTEAEYAPPDESRVRGGSDERISSSVADWPSEDDDSRTIGLIIVCATLIFNLEQVRWHVAGFIFVCPFLISFAIYFFTRFLRKFVNSFVEEVLNISLHNFGLRFPKTFQRPLESRVNFVSFAAIVLQLLSDTRIDQSSFHILDSLCTSPRGPKRSQSFLVEICIPQLVDVNASGKNWRY
jgi:hypothetical protein